MGTKKMSTLMNNNNTDGFRVWGLAVSNALAEIGLTKTDDTGQIDWTTVAFIANTFSGYEIWRFNDTLQATAPIFIKIWYGSGSGSGPINVNVQIGQGSNGAGVLTGLTSGVITPSTNWVGGLGQSYLSYLSYHVGMGFLGVHCFLAFEGYGQCGFSFMIARSCDDDGVPNAEGYTLFSRQTAYCYSFLKNANLSGGSAYAMPVGGAVSSLVGVNPQLTKFYMVTPQVRLLPALLMYVSAEFIEGSTFIATPGATPHMYKAIGNWILGGGSNNAAYWGTGSMYGVHLLAMVWE